MEIVKIAAIGIIAGILAVTIRKTSPEIALQLSLAAGVLILVMGFDYLSKVTDFLNELEGSMGSGYESIKTAVKIVGIAYIAEFCTQALRDAGEGGIASKVEFAGKLVIAVMILPLISELTNTVLSFAGAV